MSLYQLLVVNPTILSQIQQFLDYVDLIQLTQTSRFLKMIFQTIILNKLTAYQESFVALVTLNNSKKISKALKQLQQQVPNKKIKDGTQTQKLNQPYDFKMIVNDIDLIAFKTTITKLPKKFLAGQGWQQQSWEQIQQNFINHQTDLAYLMQTCNFYFSSNDGRLLLILNRSIVDPSLNFEIQTQEYDEIQEARQYLQTVADSNKYFPNDGDQFTMQEILSRQRSILSQLGQQQQVNKQIKKFLEKPNLKNVYNLNSYAIILCHGGYFALGVFNNKGQCTFHKSDHKYVTRGKQGQRQITKDSNAGSHVKSMGSTIRRDQEKKLQENVSNILSDAFLLLEACELVFLQAPGINQQLLVEDQEPLFKLKHKLRSICLTAKKATYTEVERINKIINQVWVVQANQQKENDQFF